MSHKNYMGGSEYFWILLFFFQIREILILAHAILKMSLFLLCWLLRNRYNLIFEPTRFKPFCQWSVGSLKNDQIRIGKLAMQRSMDREIGPYFWIGMQGSMDRRIDSYFQIWMQGSVDRQIGSSFLNWDAGIHGPPDWSVFLIKDAGIHEPPNWSVF